MRLDLFLGVNIEPLRNKSNNIKIIIVEQWTAESMTNGVQSMRAKRKEANKTKQKQEQKQSISSLEWQKSDEIDGTEPNNHAPLHPIHP